MAITSKEEKFVQGLVSGLSQRQAYREAYPNSKNWKDETVDSKACVLAKKDKVLERYNELIEEYKEEAVYSRLEMEADLIWIKEEARVDINKKGIRQANGTIFINAIKELAEINELYPAKKQDITVNGNVNSSSPYEGLTREQLLKLASEEDG